LKDLAEHFVLPFSYLQRLTDDTGVFQHTKFGVPDRSKGYTSDDNARALIACVLSYAKRQDESVLNLAHTYLSFLYHAQNPDGSFRNFMNYDRSFSETVGSEDCQGRCVWALGCVIAHNKLPDNLQNTCKYMLDRALPHLETLNSPRALSYALIGLTAVLEAPRALEYKLPHVRSDAFDPAFLPQARIEALVHGAAERLRLNYERYRQEDWHWYEDSLTYGNAMLPWALLKVSCLSPENGAYAAIAKESLEFLTQKTFVPEGYFRPIGSHGWYERGKTSALYDEQPIEACEMMFACLEAYRVFKVHFYYELAVRCFEWFHGGNSIQQTLIDADTGGCYDGIHSKGLNLNQGSENIVSYCMARAVMLPIRHAARNSVSKEAGSG